jgi:protocatechuate 3,4-dioxygenase beta subunit
MRQVFVRIAVLIPAMAATLAAATVRGNVVEHQTGKPLSRVLMKLLPLPGVAAQPMTTRTSQYGSFDFAGVPAGAYLLSASRQNYLTVQYGQKRWNSAGQAIVLDEAAATILNIRMPRFGAITGRVLDENEVGIPNMPVVAYRNSRPPELMARGTADEQGRYRIYGLEPGSYVVRSAAWEDETIAYLPTFSRDAEDVEQARTVDVNTDQEVDRVDLRPIRGKLVEVSGVVIPSLPHQVKLTFATDVGREETETAGAYRFGSVPPGVYEMYAEGPGGDHCEVLAAWMEVDLRRPHPVNLTVPCMSSTFVAVAGRNGQAMDASQFQILARRVDKAGAREIQEIRIESRRALLLPGRWQIMLKTLLGYFVYDMQTSWLQQGRRRSDGWNDVTITNQGSIRFIVGTNPGGVHGLVSGIAHEPVAGTPVFLEPIDSVSGKQAGDLRSAVADARGQYHFAGLAPGQYRILATFEYLSPDSEVMAASGKTLTVSEGGDRDMALDLFVM